MDMSGLYNGSARLSAPAPAKTSSKKLRVKEVDGFFFPVDDEGNVIDNRVPVEELRVPEPISTGRGMFNEHTPRRRMGPGRPLGPDAMRRQAASIHRPTQETVSRVNNKITSVERYLRSRAWREFGDSLSGQPSAAFEYTNIRADQDLLRENSRLKLQVAKLSTPDLALTRENASLKQQVATLEARYRERYTFTHTKVVEERTKLNELRRQTSSLQQENTGLKQEIAHWRGQVNGLQTHNNELVDETNILRNRMQQIRMFLDFEEQL